jgi:hypothetical protein
VAVVYAEQLHTPAQHARETKRNPIRWTLDANLQVNVLVNSQIYKSDGRRSMTFLRMAIFESSFFVLFVLLLERSFGPCQKMFHTYIYDYKRCNFEVPEPRKFSTLKCPPNLLLPLSKSDYTWHGKQIG